ncbi:hypothetical protein D7243_22920 [Stutzerimonas stutzeri]|nr:hypothetical protein [Stutzerimonas stutzeri]
MSMIDWKRAPEGWKLVPINPTPEMRSAAGAAECMAVRERRQFFAGDSWRHMVNNAPEYCAPEWTGEGLPPVGIACEVKNDIADSFDAVDEVLAHTMINGSEAAVFKRYDRVYYSFAGDFRPIRTPEQIAAEEREKAIQELIQVTCISHGEAARIHDAGYRKVTP